MGGADFLGLNTRQQEINKNSYQMQQVQKVQQQIQQQVLQKAQEEAASIKGRQKILEYTFITPDPTGSNETKSITNYDNIVSNEQNKYIPKFNNYKTDIISLQTSNTQHLNLKRNEKSVEPIFPTQDVTPDETSLDPIQIIPFPDNYKITQNTFTINDPFYNNNDTYKEYNFKGNYKITSSSNQNDAYDAYKAFTKDGTWKSGITKKLPDDYTTTEYTSSYYSGSKKTTVKQENVSIKGKTKTYNPTDIKGEWLQISLPADKPLYLFRYSIRVPNPVVYYSERGNDESYTYPSPLPPEKKYTSLFPKSFTVVGSTDGNNWYYIDQQTFVEPPDIENNRKNLNYNKGFTVNSDKSISFNLNSINRYTFFRLIITELFPGNSQAVISTWGFYGFVQNISPNIKTLESFSNQYVTEMSSSFGDDFSKDIDSNLKRTYIEQLTNLNQARNIPDPLSNLASYTIMENFDSHGFIQYNGGTTNGNTVINKQIFPTISIYKDYLSQQSQINNNVYDLSQNIYDFSKNYFKVLKDPNDKYDMSGNNFNKPPTQLDGLISDNKEFIMQQNSIFILSTITITTLVLALILVSK